MMRIYISVNVNSDRQKREALFARLETVFGAKIISAKGGFFHCWSIACRVVDIPEEHRKHGKTRADSILGRIGTEIWTLLAEERHRITVSEITGEIPFYRISNEHDRPRKRKVVDQAA